MAEHHDDTERSEDPTQKRLDEALERGDVVKSQEVNTWFIIAGATLAISPRMVVVRSLLMVPENAISTSAAPAIMNQVLTSWLLTTSPRLRASSRRFCVGSSVLLVSSDSSAMPALSQPPGARSTRTP